MEGNAETDIVSLLSMVFLWKTEMRRLTTSVCSLKVFLWKTQNNNNKTKKNACSWSYVCVSVSNVFTGCVPNRTVRVWSARYANTVGSKSATNSARLGRDLKKMKMNRV